MGIFGDIISHIFEFIENIKYVKSMSKNAYYSSKFRRIQNLLQESCK